MRLLRIAGGATLALCLILPTAAHAQTDEIQVYTGEINKRDEFSITLHDNYTAIGPMRPAFIGGIVPNHSLNGVAEYGLGITPWLELGAYLPLYTVTRDGRMLIDGGKLRALFVSPNAAEVRPILGWRSGAVDFLLNPIIDVPFRGGPKALTFAPAERIA